MQYTREQWGGVNSRAGGRKTHRHTQLHAGTQTDKNAHTHTHRAGQTDRKRAHTQTHTKTHSEADGRKTHARTHTHGAALRLQRCYEARHPCVRVCFITQPED